MAAMESMAMGQPEEKKKKKPVDKNGWFFVKFLLYVAAVILAGIIGYNIGYEEAYKKGMSLGRMKALGWIS